MTVPKVSLGFPAIAERQSCKLISPSTHIEEHQGTGPIRHTCSLAVISIK